ncbi:MAG TPA: sigma-70 family RNA polymerase sigma factor [Gemmatimonadaceae bacterium]|jgi:RNA polymerase sigma factor (sigma-70 family)|nr:sigma-70 family RNA polymerase sigma factor [Gemmatimonadaceae bacterium]
MNHRTPSLILRTFAAIGAILFGALSVWSTWTALTATTVAPLVWRIQALLADAWFPIALTLGFACAAAPRRSLRKTGWGLVFLTIVAMCLWTWHVYTHRSGPPARTATLSTLQTTVHTALRLVVTVGATLAVFDRDKRAQRIGDIYCKYSALLFTSALSRCSRDTPAAEDLVHNLFVALHDGKHDEILQRDDNAVKAYLFTYLWKSASTTTRAQRRRGQHEIQAAEFYPNTAPAADSDSNDTMLRERIDTAAKRLPPQVAKAFHFVYELDMPCVEAAKLMGLSSSTVRGYIKQACALLRPQLLDLAPPSSRRPPQSETA